MDRATGLCVSVTDTNTNMNMNISSNSIGEFGGVSSFSTWSAYMTRTCCTPTAKTRGNFSFSLNLSNRRTKILNILSNPNGTTLRRLNIVSATNSGLEASITDYEENSAALNDTKIVVESVDENKIQLRVDLTGEQTQRVFDQIVTNLGRTAPPVPGFRMRKGGKSSKIPKDFLVQMLGEERVTKFTIQEILNSTMADYAKKENMDVKDRKISTTQTAEELKRSFSPGNEFGFNVIIETENTEESS